MTVQVGDAVHAIGLEGRTIVGLAILKEMFDADAASYAEPVLKLVASVRIPCVPMDYAQLHECTLNLRNEHAFVDGLQAIFNAGRDNGVFPRSLTP